MFTSVIALELDVEVADLILSDTDRRDVPCRVRVVLHSGLDASRCCRHRSASAVGPWWWCRCRSWRCRRSYRCRSSVVAVVSVLSVVSVPVVVVSVVAVVSVVSVVPVGGRVGAGRWCVGVGRSVVVVSCAVVVVVPPVHVVLARVALPVPRLKVMSARIVSPQTRRRGALDAPSLPGRPPAPRRARTDCRHFLFDVTVAASVDFAVPVQRSRETTMAATNAMASATITVNRPFRLLSTALMYHPPS